MKTLNKVNEDVGKTNASSDNKQIDIEVHYIKLEPVDIKEEVDVQNSSVIEQVKRDIKTEVENEPSEYYTQIQQAYNIKRRDDTEYDPKDSPLHDTECNESDTTDDNERIIRNRLKPKIIRPSVDPTASHIVIPTERRSRAKKNACIFCNTLKTKLTRHLQTMHKNEQMVVDLLSFPVGSIERKRILTILTGKGNFEYNKKVLQTKTGNLIVKKRPGKKETFADNYLPCSKCFSFFSRKSLRIHSKRCKVGTCDASIKSGTALLPINKYASSELKTNVLSEMVNLKVYKIIINDDLIIKYGNYLMESGTDIHLANYIRKNLRLLGLLMLKIKEEDPSVNGLFDMLCPKSLTLLITAINKMGKLSGSVYKSPSIPILLFKHIMTCVDLALSDAVKSFNSQAQLELENFAIGLKTSSKLLINRRSTISEKDIQWEIPKNLPTTDDIKKLAEYLIEQEATQLEILQCEYNYSAWDALAKTCLIRILLFNRKRAEQIERLKIKHYKHIKQVTPHSNFYNKLNTIEKALAKNLWYLKFRGNPPSGVPILLHHNQIDAINKLLTYKKIAGVSKNNPYLFGRQKFFYLSARATLKTLSQECGIVESQLLSDAVLFNRMSTQVQLLSLCAKEVELVSNFMGRRMDKHFSSILEITRMSKLLLTLHQTKFVDVGNGKRWDDGALGQLEDLVRPIIEQLGKQSSQSHAEETSSIVADGELVSVTQEEEETKSVIPVKQETKLLLISPEEETTPSNSVSADVPPEFCLSKRKTKLPSSYSKNKGKKKIPWTIVEKKIVSSQFKHLLSYKHLPTLHECESLREKHAVLRRRTSEQIKAWVNNQNHRNS